jgi:ATP-binding cassette, subfamily B, bacterial MsbA
VISPPPFADRYGSASLIYRLVAEEGLRHWLSYAGNVALIGVVAGCTALSAYLIGHVVNETYLSHNFTAIVALSVITIVLFTIKGFASYGQSVLLAHLGNEITGRNQQRLFAKLLSENLGYFNNLPSTTVMAQVNCAVGSPAAVLDAIINTAGRDTLTVIGLGAVMIIQDPLMSIIAFVVMPLAVLSVRNLITRMRISTLNQMDSNAQMMGMLQECLQGLRVVKAFQLEDEMKRRFEIIVKTAREMANRIARLSNRSGPLMESLGGCAIALIFLYGGYRVIVMNASPGEFVSFISSFLLAYQPVKRLARVHIDLSMRLAGVRMLYEMLDSPPSEPDDSESPNLVVAAGQIEFSNVQFSYRAGEVAISGLSFIARPGVVTALVGSSGSGKSTTFNLLLRLYEADRGAILIDGQDISSVSRGSVRRQIAYVGQDVFLFDGSIRDNIACGDLSAGLEQIVKAAKAAHAHEFITDFPQGYATRVGEHGTQLSSGQRQRISIARALLRNVPIILLDEPTSALDSESEQLIQSALLELCAGRTTLMIAHRLNMVKQADCIYVIERGLVVESGRHEDLLYRRGRYATLYRHMLNDPKTATKKLLAFPQ